jgi:predicted dehydrogenase
MNQETTENNKPIPFAYVGAGFVAQRIHIPNFCSLPNCRFVALAEARAELGQEVAGRHGIPKVYTSHEQIAADPDIEAVGVSGPYALQGAIAEDLLRAGKHVFMEKPMAVSASRAESIVAAEKASGKRLMVGYMKRYDPGNLLLKQHADAWRTSGKMGRLLFARNHGFCGNWVYAQDPNVPETKSSIAAPPAPDECPAWLPDRWKGAYLGYLQQWTHNVNLLRFFLGGDEEAPRIMNVDLDDDGMTGLLSLRIGGVRAVVESASTRFHGWEEHTQIYFEGGWLRTEAPPLMQKEQSATVEVYQSASGAQPARRTEEFAPPAWSYREEAKHFLHCVQSGSPFSSSASDTLIDVRLFEEVYRHWLTARGEV